MTESYGSGFGFKPSVKGEPATYEMMEEPKREDFEEFVAEVPAPAPEPTVEPRASAAPAPKYEISQRPMRAKKRR